MTVILNTTTGRIAGKLAKGEELWDESGDTIGTYLTHTSTTVYFVAGGMIRSICRV